MKAKDLYTKLNKYFSVDSLKDDWSFMEFNDYIFSGFKERYIGLILDNTSEVKKVYTATMPDLDILDKLINTNQRDLLLFSHHAMGYDPNISGIPFYSIPEEYLAKLKQQRISFYMLHVPLDKNGEYSTSVNLAKHLKLEIEDEFCEYFGVQCGVVCSTKKRTASELADYVCSIIGHDVKLIRNGTDKIRNGRVGIAAGGGSVDFAVRELADLGINMYITGNTRKVSSVETISEFHKIIEVEHINVIGATHYTTEKYACIAMVRYFEKLGVPAEFLEGKYFLEDL